MEYELAYYDGGITVPPDPHSKGTLRLIDSEFELRFKRTKGRVRGSLSEFSFEAEDLVS